MPHELANISASQTNDVFQKNKKSREKHDKASI
jgi:hypothetical protein